MRYNLHSLESRLYVLVWIIIGVGGMYSEIKNQKIKNQKIDPGRHGLPYYSTLVSCENEDKRPAAISFRLIFYKPRQQHRKFLMMMMILGLQSSGHFRAERRSMPPVAGRLDSIRVVPTFMRTLGISRGHILILYSCTKGLGRLKRKETRDPAIRPESAMAIDTSSNLVLRASTDILSNTFRHKAFNQITSHFFVSSRAFLMLPLAAQKFCKAKAASFAKFSAAPPDSSTCAAAVIARQRS